MGVTYGGHFSLRPELLLGLDVDRPSGPLSALADLPHDSSHHLPSGLKWIQRWLT